MSDLVSGTDRTDVVACRQTGLLILGMHRSGTSALTGLLGKLGVDLGPKLIAGRVDNPLGFFEHEDIVTLNDEVLAKRGSSWDDPRFDPDMPKKLTQRLSRSIETVLETDFGRSQVYAIKDPRVCRFPDIYVDAMRRSGASVIQIVALRSPLEVGQSLLSRNGIEIEQSAWLWLRHTIAAVKSAGCKVENLVFYDRLLDEPDFEAERIIKLIGLPADIIELRRHSVNNFITPRLRHHGNDRGCEAGRHTPDPLLAAQKLFSDLQQAHTDDAVALALETADVWLASNSDELAYRAYLQHSFLQLSELIKNIYASKQDSYPVRYFLLRFQIKLTNLSIKRRVNHSFVKFSLNRLNKDLAKSDELIRKPRAFSLVLSGMQKAIFNFPK